MFAIGKLGDTFQIRVLLYDGENPLAGETVNCHVERLSDNKFWSGGAWAASPSDLSMTDMSDGTDHYDGLYQYSFTDNVSTTPQTYDWSVKFEESGTAYRRRWRGTIDTTWDPLYVALAEQTAKYSATPAVKDVLSLMGMLLRDEVSVTPTQWSLKNDAGTVIIKSTISDAAGTFTKNEVVNGP
jgi:hypothetical protein